MVPNPGSIARLLAIGVLAILAMADGARADAVESGAELSLRFQNYKPALDSEFSSGVRPYALAFGTGGMWGMRLEYAATWPRAFGTAGLGLGVGYLGASGHGLYRDTSGQLAASRDATALHVIPVSAFVLFRLDQPLARGGIPVIAPYARASLERYIWVATAAEQASETGATNGWGFTLGLAVFLDGIDRTLAGELHRETGIRHVMMTLDASKDFVNDFGASGSWDLSTSGWSFAGGLLFAF